jgi:hypothetical protein
MPLAKSDEYPPRRVFTDPREKAKDDYIFELLDRFYDEGWIVDYRFMPAYEGRMHALLDYDNGPRVVDDEYAGKINQKLRDWGYNSHVRRIEDHSLIYTMWAKRKGWEEDGIRYNESFHTPTDYTLLIKVLSPYDSSYVCELYLCPRIQ